MEMEKVKDLRRRDAQANRYSSLEPHRSRRLKKVGNLVDLYAEHCLEET